ncbi:MFS transporter [Roseateles noduli]|uniref:MFS transporter n=1 Tax=Roseateles noduli TaxID=2052484 RepID=UPI003D661B3F
MAYNIAFAMMFFGFFVYLTDVWHYSISRAGIAVMPGPMSVVIVAMFIGPLFRKYGRRFLLLSGSVLLSATALWFMGIPGDAPNYFGTWLPGMLISGVGVGILIPGLAAATVSELPAQKYSVGSAINQTVRQIGSVLGVAVFVGAVGIQSRLHADFGIAYGIQFGFSLLTCGLCALIRDPATA